MKKSILLGFLAAGLSVCGFAQKKPATSKSLPLTNTLLWRVSGNGLAKPTYLFGTMHMLCGDDIVLSDSLKSAINKADNVYLELDMDNMMEMFGAMMQMNMKGDTTLADLLTKKEYQTVKEYFQSNSSMLPFSMLETMKPMMASALLAQGELKTSCAKMIVMEQLVMQEAQSAGVETKGLESMAYQVGIFDKIPYKAQAKSLYQMIAKKDDTTSANEMEMLTKAYRQQQLNKLEEYTKHEDMGVANFTDLLLYQRNENWVEKLKTLMTTKSLVVAVGAGHLPGDRGVINLLKKAGYKVDPVKNEMVKRVGGQI
jgi:uncharacterized protein